ncbi:MAG: 1-aminocyclopropane-1-carboxylate deaminase, partial [Mariniflexile sp.]
MIFNLKHSINQQISLPKSRGVDLYVKREDKIHPFVSGNKY